MGAGLLEAGEAVSKPVHLYSSYDEEHAWCGHGSTPGTDGTVDPRQTTCEPCLIAAEQYGDACTMRRAELALGIESDTLMHGTGSDWEKR